MICKKIIIIRQIFRPPHASIADAKMSNKFKDILNTEAIHGGRFDRKAFTAEIWKGRCATPKRPSLLHLSCPPTPWLLLWLWLWLLLWLWLCHNLCGGNPQVVAASHTRETLPPTSLLHLNCPPPPWLWLWLVVVVAVVVVVVVVVFCVTTCVVGIHRSWRPPTPRDPPTLSLHLSSPPPPSSNLWLSGTTTLSCWIINSPQTLKDKLLIHLYESLMFSSATTGHNQPTNDSHNLILTHVKLDSPNLQSR